MILDYYIVDPTGNITALVLSKTDTKYYSDISSIIMSEHPNVEQVGFVDFSCSTPKLRMAGGEFCGNATISTAALFCELNNILSAEITVDVFGTPKPIQVEIIKNQDIFNGKIFLPKPKRIYNKSFMINEIIYEFPVVEYDGISHIIADYGMDTDTGGKILKKYCDLMNLQALGIMIYKEEDNSLLPLVYVKECDTCVCENSCISGSCALTAFLSKKNNNVDIVLNQPGGKIRVFACEDKPEIVLVGNAAIAEHIIRDVKL